MSTPALDSVATGTIRRGSGPEVRYVASPGPTATRWALHIFSPVAPLTAQYVDAPSAARAVEHAQAHRIGCPA